MAGALYLYLKEPTEFRGSEAAPPPYVIKIESGAPVQPILDWIDHITRNGVYLPGKTGDGESYVSYHPPWEIHEVILRGVDHKTVIGQFRGVYPSVSDSGWMR